MFIIAAFSVWDLNLGQGHDCVQVRLRTELAHKHLKEVALLKKVLLAVLIRGQGVEQAEGKALNETVFGSHESVNGLKLGLLLTPEQVFIGKCLVDLGANISFRALLNAPN